MGKKEIIAGSATVAAMAAAATSATAADAGAGNGWSGFYAGLSVGTVSGDLPSPGYSDEENYYGLNSAFPHISGFMGFNHEMGGNIILGGELALGGPVGEQTTGPGSTKYYHTYGINWNMDAKAKLGYDLGRFMVYGVAGASSAQATGSDFKTYLSYGWNLGAGVEAKVSDHVMLGAEFLHRDLGYTRGGTAYSFPDNEFALRASYQLN